MNMPVGRWGGLVVMASALGDHPMVGSWLRDAGRYFNMLLETEYSPDGVAVSCPHYIGASSTSFYAWIILANSGQGIDVSKSPVIRNQAWPPVNRLAKPFTWKRLLLNVKDEEAAGLNYLAIRDDFGGWAERTRHFNYWALADGVEFDGPQARFKGSLGIDTDMHVAWPPQATLHKDSFTTKECESIVGARSQSISGKPFSETYALARMEGRKGEGFLVTLVPRKADEPPAQVEPWAGGKGVKVTAQGQTHYILLGPEPQLIEADGIKAEAAAVVVKVIDATRAVLSLPLGGRLTFRGQTLESKEPAEANLTGGTLTPVKAGHIHRD
jgi:hypothetical protein